MNIIEPPAPRVQTPPRGMLLHCGAEIVSRDQLFAVPTPRGTQTWYSSKNPSSTRVLTELFLRSPNIIKNGLWNSCNFRSASRIFGMRGHG